jgi:hypothetical protein
LDTSSALCPFDSTSRLAELKKYLGKDDGFDHSVTDFSERYADQNERDYKAFSKSIRSERLTAVEGV